MLTGGGEASSDLDTERVSFTLYVVLVVFEVIVIHGYRRGHAIRDMLAESFFNDHIRTRFYDTSNKGVTYLLIFSGI